MCRYCTCRQITLCRYGACGLGERVRGARAEVRGKGAHAVGGEAVLRFDGEVLLLLRLLLLLLTLLLAVLCVLWRAFRRGRLWEC
jgi:hypothetical protein